MKCVHVLAFAALIVPLMAFPSSSDWELFKTAFKKTYSSETEELLRKKIFTDNVQVIEEHNARYEAGEETYFLGINKYTDVLNEELSYLRGIKKGNTPSPAPTGPVETFDHVANDDLPDTVDWRKEGYVSPVKTQLCSDCYAYATVGSIEGQHYKKTGELVSLSTQEIVDCSSMKYQDNHCNGSYNMWGTFDFVKDIGGMESETDYPHTGVDGTCKFDSSEVTATIKGHQRVAQDEDSLKKAVATVGPITIVTDASHLTAYAGGIFGYKGCGEYLDHGVLIVGYGSDDGKDYWLIKNSWGTDFGLDGYYKVARNAGNMCGITDEAVYPLV